MSRSAWSLARTRVRRAALSSDDAGAHSSLPVRAHPARSSVSARRYSRKAPRSSPRAARASASASRSPATCRAATRCIASLNVRYVTVVPSPFTRAISSVCSARRRRSRSWEGSVRPNPRHASTQASRSAEESERRRASCTVTLSPFLPVAPPPVRPAARKRSLAASSARRIRRLRCARWLCLTHVPSLRRSQPPPSSSMADGAGAPRFAAESRRGN